MARPRHDGPTPRCGALLARIAALAVERGCGRVEWAVLDWNEPALGFYRSLGAGPVDGWTTYRLAGSALRDFAATWRQRLH